jgi:hypothetical protein
VAPTSNAINAPAERSADERAFGATHVAARITEI